MAKENSSKFFFLIYSALRAGAIGSISGSVILFLIAVYFSFINNKMGIIVFIFSLSSISFSPYLMLSSTILIGIPFHLIMQKLHLTGYAWYGFISFISSYVLLISVFSHQIALKGDFGPSSSGAFAGLDQGRRECATRTASVSYKNLVAGKNSQQIMLCITGAV